MQIVEKISYSFSKSNSPSNTACDGETLAFKTVDCYGGNSVLGEMPIYTPGKANGASGPVFVAGAQPGDALAVDIFDISVGRCGFIHASSRSGPLRAVCEDRTKLVHVKDGAVEFNGISWNAKPMIGVIGVAPEDGAISSFLAGRHGGNMDSKLIAKGAKVYLPVRVPGALLQIGDLHASMGDGEVCGTGIEIAGLVTARVKLVKSAELHWPLTETSAGWHINAAGATVESAMTSAAHELARLLCKAWGWDATDAFMYLSVRGDAGINQCCVPCDNVQVVVRFSIPKEPGMPALIS
ncbi:MAG: acetamidase/formamidase family protein [Clostridiales bacterium]|jgi:amidase|nr:acetamidase/formamidase family protein [Clostridiales bacterium]